MNHQLPPLPEARIGTKFFSDGLGDVRAKDTKPYYLPKDMTAYGLQCAEAERARCIAICAEVADQELDRRQHYASSVAAICGVRIHNGTTPAKQYTATGSFQAQSEERFNVVVYGAGGSGK